MYVGGMVHDPAPFAFFFKEMSGEEIIGVPTGVVSRVVNIDCKQDFAQAPEKKSLFDAERDAVIPTHVVTTVS